MKQGEDRYFFCEETDGTLSICDRHVVEADRENRVVFGLQQDQAAELLRKLNSDPSESPK
ncbi:hypothetical protein [Agrobacterium rosae]|uniref:Uncharacterized protein n=1 Tax=Agrobacterium rosae TaxID=1972867 RepID=A0AAW9FR88_9HYPH|nr:hypothetical protein [Agrobacterium rosae]MDX8306013.1 hypothetical protein [Agrobacterium rosae]